MAALTGQNAQAANVSSARAIGARVIQNIATGTTPVSNAATVVKSSGNGGVRGGTVSPTAAAPARGSARSGSVFSLRTGDPRSAESTARDANVERIVRVIRNRLSGDRSHTVIRLDPPELGRVRLQMDLRGASLVLQVDTTTELAHRLLSKDLEKLRDGLESSGIQLARVEIRPPTTVPDTNEQNPSQQADTRDDTQGGSAQADAEHPQEHGKDSHPAGSVENVTRELNQEPAMESLVNVVA
jgi:flagellar hook-length control protein FliK